jgi:hypothetical protein
MFQPFAVGSGVRLGARPSNWHHRMKCPWIESHCRIFNANSILFTILLKVILAFYILGKNNYCAANITPNQKLPDVRIQIFSFLQVAPPQRLDAPANIIPNTNPDSESNSTWQPDVKASLVMCHRIVCLKVTNIWGRIYLHLLNA